MQKSPFMKKVYTKGYSETDKDIDRCWEQKPFMYGFFLYILSFFFLEYNSYDVANYDNYVSCTVPGHGR